jgi:hypothetical protein
VTGFPMRVRIDEQFDGEEECHRAAVSAATRMIGWAFFAAWVVCFCIAISLLFINAAAGGLILACLVCVGITAAPIIIIIGAILGTLAIRFSGHSTISPVRMAVALALTFNFTVLGWFVLMTQVKSIE